MMFESLRDRKGDRRFRLEYIAQEELIGPDTWQKFEISKRRFFNHCGVFFDDEWVSIVDRGIFRIGFSNRRTNLNWITNFATMKGWYYLDFRSFNGVVASRSTAPSLAELGRASRPPLDNDKTTEVIESLRRRFEGIGFRAFLRAWDGQLFWGGDDGSHRFAALFQYCVEYNVALSEPFRLSIRKIDAGTLAKLQTEWCLFLAPPEIGRAVNRAATALYQRRRDLDPSKILAYTAALESVAIDEPIELLAVRATSPGAVLLSSDWRLSALNPLLDQACRKQTINIQELISAVERVDL
jgi:hypothetical protein